MGWARIDEIKGAVTRRQLDEDPGARWGSWRNSTGRLEAELRALSDEELHARIARVVRRDGGRGKGLDPKECRRLEEKFGRSCPRVRFRL